MWNKATKEQLAELPRFDSNAENIILMHFFIGGCDWYAAEFDGEDTFYGFAIINNDLDMAEWGYFSLSELDDINIAGIEVDYDLYWKPRKAIEVDKIRQAQGW